MIKMTTTSFLFLLFVATVLAVNIYPTLGVEFEVDFETGQLYSNGRYFDGSCVANITHCFLQQRYTIDGNKYANDGTEFACLSPNGTNLSGQNDFDRDDTLILCDCTEEDGFFFDYDPVTSVGVFRLMSDDTICLQAGHEDVKDGSKIRLYPCDWSNDRQTLWYVSDGQVRLSSYPNLCMVPHGSLVNMCQSDVIVKECDVVSPERRSWNFRTKETLIRQILGPILVGENAPFPNSDLQAEALVWVVYEDMATLPTGPVETYQLVQRYVAAVMYLGTDGPNWYNNSMWLSPTSVCEWDGVKCYEEDENGFIESLNLNNNGLTGSIVSEIGTLSELRVLDLSENLLDGSIPSQIGNLVDLSSLVLACNDLTGDIPEPFTNLVNLEDLCLGGNDVNSTDITENLMEIPCLSASEECNEPLDDIDVAISRNSDGR